MTREEIAKWLENLKGDIGKSENQPLWHYAEALDMAIEALQIDIVRCRSCIHGQKILKAKEEVACDIWGGIWTENGFCSCGERREDENGVDS